MLTYLSTNLLTSPAQTLVNTVNTVGVMGKGIALEFKQRYPEMYQQYRELCKAGRLVVGKLFIYRTPNKIIVNFPTKQHWRNPAKLEYIEAGLQEFVRQYEIYGISSVSFPQLGCGNGELEWATAVQPVMERYLKPLPISVYIHLYSPPASFVPEHLERSTISQLSKERAIIPFAEVWQELKTVAVNQPHAHCRRSKTFITEEEIIFHVPEDRPLIVYRQDVEDLWHTLRLSGTVSADRVPEPIRADGATEYLFDLLAQLPYVDPIQFYSATPNGHNRGLQYQPPAENTPDPNEEIVV